jgi:hypothetical protein
MTISEFCRSCSEKISDEVEDSIECDYCNSWTHADRKCSGLPKAVFNFMSKNTDILWFCKNCVNKCKDAIKETKRDQVGTRPKLEWLETVLKKEIELNRSLLDKNKE